MDKDIAANYILKKVPVIKQEATCKEAIDQLRNVSFNYIERVYLVDKERHLIGWIKSSRLFTISKEEKIASIMSTKIPTILPDTDQERMASIAIKYKMSAIPVIDSQKHFLGVVPAQAIIGILRKEHIEDLHRLTGISQEITHVYESITEPPAIQVRHRLPWLLAGVGGSIAATYLMSGFEDVLEQHISLAFFIPGIIYLADAIGTQSETIAVRGISLSGVSFRRMVAGELGTGVIIGLILGLIYLPFSWLMFHQLSLAITVSLTIVLAGSIATTIGIIFPWILHYLKVDPAFGSGPIATIIQDILSILVFFMIAYWMVL